MWPLTLQIWHKLLRHEWIIVPFISFIYLFFLNESTKGNTLLWQFDQKNNNIAFVTSGRQGGQPLPGLLEPRLSMTVQSSIKQEAAAGGWLLNSIMQINE